MLILAEHGKSHSLQELNSDITYTKIKSKKEVFEKLIAWKKKSNKFKVSIGFITMDGTLMSGFYNKIKIEGTGLKMADTRTPFNYLILYAKDIVSAELAENAETAYEGLNLKMRSKYTVFITPWK